MPESTATLGELITFFHDAICVGLLTGAILGPVGLFLHLRRSLFLGAALPQLAGFAFVVATVLKIPEWVSALLLLGGFALFAGFKPLRGRGYLTFEALIALAYTVSMAGVVLLLALTNAESHASELLLKGSVLAATCQDTRLLAIVGVPLVGLLFLLRRRLYLISLDPETARTLGIQVSWYEVFLFLTLGVAITLTLTEAGALACFGFLLLPTLSAQALCRGVGPMFLVSGVTGVIGAAGGLALALSWDLPAGPAMIVSLLALWLLSLAISRFRG